MNGKLTRIPPPKPTPQAVTRQLTERTRSDQRARQMLDLQELRETYLGSFYAFVKGCLGKDKLTDTFHRPFCDVIVNPPAPKQLVLIPRGFYKTTICSVAYPIWLLCRDPNTTILIASATVTLGQHVLREIKAVFERNAVFRSVFRDRVPEDFTKTKWTETELVIPRTLDGKEPSMQVVGVGGTIVGQHFRVAIFDDLINEKHEASPDEMQKVIDWHEYAMSLLVEPTRDRELVVGTRWAFSDLYSHLVERGQFALYQRAAIEDGVATFPEQFSLADLKEIETRQGPYKYSCTPVETPILMADWTTKPIHKVQVGDEVVGMELGTPKCRKRLVRATVQRTFQYDAAPIVRVTMASGRVIRCTTDHRWYNGRNEKDGRQRRRIYAEPAVGRRIAFVCEPQFPNLTPEQEWWAAWLAGIFDGEGHFSRQGLVVLSQSHVKNPEVTKRIHEALSVLGFPYQALVKENRDPTRPGASAATMFYLLGGDGPRVNRRDVTRRFLHHVRPFKWRERMIETFYTRGKRPIQNEDAVVSITPDGAEPVYALETTTGNYVAWGYVSSNSLYQNHPTDPARQVFRPEWCPQVEDSQSLRDEISGWTVYALVDPALSTRRDGSYTGYLLAAVGPGYATVILAGEKHRWTVGDLIERLFNDAVRFPDFVIGVEMVSLAKALKYPIDQEMSRRGKFLRLTVLQPDTRQSKEMRIRALQPYFANRLFRFVTGACDPLMRDIRDFPFGDGNYDALDALSYLPHLWTEGQIITPRELRPEDDPLNLEHILRELRERGVGVGNERFALHRRALWEARN